jgi:hypothetical protein
MIATIGASVAGIPNSRRGTAISKGYRIWQHSLCSVIAKTWGVVFSLQLRDVGGEANGVIPTAEHRQVKDLGFGERRRNA